MQYSHKSLTRFNHLTFPQYIFTTLFIIFTVVLCLLTRKAQLTCHPLVGNSTCVSEHHSLLKDSWEVTNKTVFNIENRTKKLVEKSKKMLPFSFLNR